MADEPIPSLPPGWGREKLVALPRDSRAVWLYWELSPAKLVELSKSASGARPTIHLVHADTLKPVADSSCDLETGRAWIQAMPGESFYAELGLANFGRSFTVLLRSGIFTMPWGDELRERTRTSLELPEELKRFKPPKSP